jgi:GrpB-like predicted nucleotidyltransferase (UPF0157 family)
VTPILVDYDSRWPAFFAEEAARVLAVLGFRCVGVEHIGSTAVAGLPARPVIDLLVALRGPLTSRDSRALRHLGYAHLRARRDGRLVFRKGAPRTHSLHVAELGSDGWQAALRFRDYLRARPEEAARYGRLKFELARLRNPGAYSTGKAAFIVAALRQAAPEGDAGARKLGGRAGSRTLRTTEVYTNFLRG